MCYQNTGTDSVEYGGHGVGDDLGVIGAGIGRHLAKKLIQRFVATGKLRSFKKVGPDAEPELPEPELFVRLGLNSGGNGTSPGIAASGLIYQINAESPTQKNILKTFASVRCGFPRLG